MDRISNLSRIKELEAVLGMSLKKYICQKYNRENMSDNRIAREIVKKYHYSTQSTTIRNYRLKLGVKSKEKTYKSCARIG